jgi:hypothetical protein
VKHQSPNVAVTVDPQASASLVDLTANPGVGIPVQKGTDPASLDVDLTSTPSTTHAVASYTWDFDGSGSEDLKCYSHSEVKASYQNTGLYLSKVTIKDTQGNQYADTAIVNVVNPADMDGIFKGIWSGMKEKLRIQDVDGAVGYFTARSQDRYRSIFNAVSADLPQIAQDMQDIQLIYVHDNIVKYRIRRDELYGGATVTLTYYIYFVRDDNGLWGIESF